MYDIGEDIAFQGKNIKKQCSLFFLLLRLLSNIYPPFAYIVCCKRIVNPI
jgi:hypothetical protein